MARLQVNDKVALGEFIIKAATDDTLRRDLVENDKATELLAKYVKYPVDADGKPIPHRIVVHADTENETHIVLPTKADVEAATDHIDEQKGGMYPTQYIPGSPDYIDEVKFPEMALQFRFGEYTFGRCKH